MGKREGVRLAAPAYAPLDGYSSPSSMSGGMGFRR
jgi:hypothetical protein